MGFIYWIVVGLIAGWLAGKVMKGGGYGVVMDIVLGILGGVVGGFVFGLLRTPCGWTNWFDHRLFCWRADSGVDHPAAEKGLAQYQKKIRAGSLGRETRVGRTPFALSLSRKP